MSDVLSNEQLARAERLLLLRQLKKMLYCFRGINVCIAKQSLVLHTDSKDTFRMLRNELFTLGYSEEEFSPAHVAGSEHDNSLRMEGASVGNIALRMGGFLAVKLQVITT